MSWLTAALGRPAVGMAAGTAASRITGLLRTVALAAALGVGTLSDAYNTANTAPNMLFALAAGGVLGAALVPMLAKEHDAARRREAASVILGTVTVVSVAISVLLALAAPQVMRLLAAGAGARNGEQELLTLGTTWMRLFAPQVALYAIGVTATGIMAASGRLALGAAAPVATNVITITAAIAFTVLAGGDAPAVGVVPDGGVALLGWGTTIAVAAMAAIQLWGARHTVPGLSFAPRLRHPAVQELRRLGGWVLLYVAVNQVGVAAVIALASSVSGGVTAYQWSFMLMQLPYAIVAVSIFSAAYPGIARAASAGTDLTASLRRPATTAVDLLLPGAAALFLLARPLAAIAVGPEGAGLVAAGLRGFAFSLVPFALFQLLTRASYARSDARTPAVVNVAVNLVMLVVDVGVLLTVEGDVATMTGLAVGHAASYVAGCALLGRWLHRQGALHWRPSPRRVGRLTVATGVLATTISLVAPLWSSDSRLGAILSLGAGGTAGLVAYGLVATRLGVLPAVGRSLSPQTQS